MNVSAAAPAWLIGVVALAAAITIGGAAARGAKPADAKHWAFVPVQRPGIPIARGKGWVHNPIDAFVLAQLEKKQIAPAPTANRRTLIRRVYLDLIGLPPTPQEIRAFLNDTSPQAYERVVDDLLTRPQYGERWARHWLDVVRYAESNGYERDGAKPSAWRYRDYVIEAFNRDKPFDRFVLEQVAGDEIPNSNTETQIATTFLRLGTWDDEPAEPLMDRYEQLDDVLGTTATAFLGVTLRCARCHDHKFEPFTQKDYYRMLAVFQPLKRPQQGRKELDLPVGSAEELAAFRESQGRLTAKLATIPRKVVALKERIRMRMVAQQPHLPGLPANVAGALRTEPAQRTREQKKQIEQLAPQIDKLVASAASAEERAQLKRWDEQLAAALAGLVAPKGMPRAYIWSEVGPTAPRTHVLQRGDPTKPAEEVGPGLPEVLAHRQPAPPQPLAKTTGRRLWLGRWLSSAENPLTARVIVNRIWQHHFGTGLVASANDFGVMGEAPTHPELLDWLAADFMAGGWRMKRLQRLIVLSNTYQLASQDDPASRKIDPDVQLLWRWKQRRLEAEAVRDSILAVSGRLNLQMKGPSVYPVIPRGVLEGQSRPGEGWGKSDPWQAARRSVYIFVKRVLAVPELELLDSPDTTSSCEQRPVSTTAPQALTFLNGEFTYEQAGHFANRLVRESGLDSRSQVRRAFELAFGRPPLAREERLALNFLAAQRKQIEADSAATLTAHPASSPRPRTRGRGDGGEGVLPQKTAPSPQPLSPEYRGEGLSGQTLTAHEAGHKALRALCLVLLNTNELFYVR